MATRSRKTVRWSSAALLALLLALALIGGTSAQAASGRGDGSENGHARNHTVVVLLDTGNTGRSVMAEAVANKFLADKGWTDITVMGRGINVDPTFTSPEPDAVQLMAARGIDVSHHVAIQLTAEQADDANLILPVSFKNLGQVITFLPDSRDKSFLLGDFAVGDQRDITDAFGQPLSVYQAALAQIDQYVPAALTKIHATNEAHHSGN